MIQKNIHHVYISDKTVSDKKQWPTIWQRCHDSWLTAFSKDEYEHFFWDDEFSENFIKENYPEYFDFYFNLPFKILKADIIRLFALHYYGGIYSDLDVYCYKNFYHMIDKEFKIAEHRFGIPGEFLQNSLIASEKNNHFLIACIDRAVELFENTDYKFLKSNDEQNINMSDMTYITLNFAGPLGIQKMFKKSNYTHENFFSYKKFNNHRFYYDEELYTRHIGTCFWDTQMKNFNSADDHFSTHMKIKPEDLDFYKNYLVS